MADSEVAGALTQPTNDVGSVLGVVRLGLGPCR